MTEEFENLIDELYPEGLTDTQLNDILWFEEEWIYESLGIKTEEEETEKTEEYPNEVKTDPQQGEEQTNNEE